MAHVKRHLGGQTGIGAHTANVQAALSALFNFEAGLHADGRQFYHLFADHETFRIGGIPAQAMHTPGHTPACMTYPVGDAAFVGDTLCMPDAGTARCDFPGGDAATMYRSVQRLALPPDTRLFVCHDYGLGGRPAAWETTVAEQRESNIHVRNGVTEQAFVALRTARDGTLSLPALILPSLQINLRAGELPAPGANGVGYLKIPLNQV
jgi:glyoxylase-like metal-dependent hydrolase (beta-lactamase superfamily II)